jgi:hypothetical protein
MLQRKVISIVRKKISTSFSADEHLRILQKKSQNFSMSNFPNKWIDRGGPIRLANRSTDLTHLIFYLWGNLKKQMLFKKASKKL